MRSPAWIWQRFRSSLWQRGEMRLGVHFLPNGEMLRWSDGTTAGGSCMGQGKLPPPLLLPALPTLLAVGRVLGTSGFGKRKTMGGRNEWFGWFYCQERVQHGAELIKVTPLWCFINRISLTMMSELFSCAKMNSTGRQLGCLLCFSRAGQPQTASSLSVGLLV